MPADAIISQRRGFNIAAPGANANIFATTITPSYPVSALRVTVVLAVAAVLNFTVTNSGTTFTCGLNQSLALNSGDAYTFVFGVNGSNTYNFQVETDGIIRVLQVDEVPEGVV